MVMQIPIWCSCCRLGEAQQPLRTQLFDNASVCSRVAAVGEHSMLVLFFWLCWLRICWALMHSTCGPGFRYFCKVVKYHVARWS
jgi:hypothetical protein